MTLPRHTAANTASASGFAEELALPSTLLWMPRKKPPASFIRFHHFKQCPNPIRYWPSWIFLLLLCVLHALIPMAEAATTIHSGLNALEVVPIVRTPDTIESSNDESMPSLAALDYLTPHQQKSPGPARSDDPYKEFLVVLADGSMHFISADGHVKWSNPGLPSLMASEDASANGDPSKQQESPRRLLTGPEGMIFYKGEDGKIIPLPISVKDIVFHSPFSTPLFPDVYLLGQREAIVESLDFETGEKNDLPTTHYSNKSNRDGTEEKPHNLDGLEGSARMPPERMPPQLRVGQTRWLVKAVDIQTHVEQWRLEWREVTPVIDLGASVPTASTTATSSAPFSTEPPIGSSPVGGAAAGPAAEQTSYGIDTSAGSPHLITGAVQRYEPPLASARSERQTVKQLMAVPDPHRPGATREVVALRLRDDLELTVDGVDLYISNISSIVDDVSMQRRGHRDFTDRHPVSGWLERIMERPRQSPEYNRAVFPYGVPASPSPVVQKLFRLHFPSSVVGVYSLEAVTTGRADYLALMLLLKANPGLDLIGLGHPENKFPDDQLSATSAPLQVSPRQRISDGLRRKAKALFSVLTTTATTATSSPASMLSSKGNSDARIFDRTAAYGEGPQQGICPVETIVATLGGACVPRASLPSFESPGHRAETRNGYLSASAPFVASDRRPAVATPPTGALLINGLRFLPSRRWTSALGLVCIGVLVVLGWFLVAFIAARPTIMSASRPEGSVPQQKNQADFPRDKDRPSRLLSGQHCNDFAAEGRPAAADQSCSHSTQVPSTSLDNSAFSIAASDQNGEVSQRSLWIPTAGKARTLSMSFLRKIRARMMSGFVRAEPDGGVGRSYDGMPIMNRLENRDGLESGSRLSALEGCGMLELQGLDEPNDRLPRMAREGMVTLEALRSPTMVCAGPNAGLNVPFQTARSRYRRVTYSPTGRRFPFERKPRQSFQSDSPPSGGAAALHTQPSEGRRLTMSVSTETSLFDHQPRRYFQTPSGTRNAPGNSSPCIPLGPQRSPSMSSSCLSGIYSPTNRSRTSTLEDHCNPFTLWKHRPSFQTSHPSRTRFGSCFADLVGEGGPAGGNPERIRRAGSERLLFFSEDVQGNGFSGGPDGGRKRQRIETRVGSISGAYSDFDARLFSPSARSASDPETQGTHQQPSCQPTVSHASTQFINSQFDHQLPHHSQDEHLDSCQVLDNGTVADPLPLERANAYRQPPDLLQVTDSAALARNLMLPCASPLPVQFGWAVSPTSPTPHASIPPYEGEGHYSHEPQCTGSWQSAIVEHPQLGDRYRMQDHSQQTDPSRNHHQGSQFPSSPLSYQLRSLVLPPSGPQPLFSQSPPPRLESVAVPPPPNDSVIPSHVDQSIDPIVQPSFPHPSPSSAPSLSAISGPVSLMPENSVWSRLLDNGRFTRTFTDVERIGAGGFGCVFRVRHRVEPDNPLYAVKFVTFRVKASDDIAKRRYFREVSANRDLFSRQVVRYFTWWCEEPQFLPDTACCSGDRDSNLPPADLSLPPAGKQGLKRRRSGVGLRHHSSLEKGRVKGASKTRQRGKKRRSEKRRLRRRVNNRATAEGGGAARGNPLLQNSNRIHLCREKTQRRWTPFSDSSDSESGGSAGDPSQGGREREGRLNREHSGERGSAPPRYLLSSPSLSVKAPPERVSKAATDSFRDLKRSRNAREDSFGSSGWIPQACATSPNLGRQDSEFIVFEEPDVGSDWEGLPELVDESIDTSCASRSRGPMSSLSINASDAPERRGPSFGLRKGSNLRRQYSCKATASGELFGSVVRRTTRRALAASKRRWESTAGDVTTIDSEPFVTIVLLIQMELVSGMTLRNWLDRPERTSQPMDIVRAFQSYYCGIKKSPPPMEVTLFTQLIKGLRDIHVHGIVHRDIKPDNIFVNENPLTLKIGDFGLARFIEAKAWSSAEPLGQSKQLGQTAVSEDVKRIDSVASVTGLIIGTPGYTAPEGGALCSEKADIFSAALILLELLCPRFRTAMERLRTLEDFRTKQIVPPHIMLHIKEWGILMKCMGSQNPRDRPSANMIYRVVKQRMRPQSLELPLSMPLLGHSLEVKEPLSLDRSDESLRAVHAQAE